MTDEPSALAELCCSSEVGDLAEALRRLDDMRQAALHEPETSIPFADGLRLAAVVGGDLALTIIDRVAADVQARYTPLAEGEVEWLSLCDRLREGPPGD